MESKEEVYITFKDLMKKTYEKIFCDENKKIFTPEDAVSLLLLGMAVDALNAELCKEIMED